MIPGIAEILEMFKAGECTMTQALGWIEQHMATADLRDHFATHAPSDIFDTSNWSVGECCQAIGLGNPEEYNWREHYPLLHAHLAYEYADAMLKARSA